MELQLWQKHSKSPIYIFIARTVEELFLAKVVTASAYLFTSTGAQELISVKNL